VTNQNQIISLVKSIGFIALYLFFGAILAQLKPLFPQEFERYAQGITGTIGVFIAVLIFLKLEKKTLKDYGLYWDKRTLSKFGLGLLLGVVLACIMMFSQIAYSQLELSVNKEVSLLPFIFWSLAFVPLAFMEEIAFRSYPLLTLNKAFGFRATQIILALLFAIYHMLMMWGLKASFLGPGIWALAYALTAVISKGIAAPTGLHFGLNLVQSVIGGQKGIDPLFTLDYPTNATESTQIANEQFGIGLHIALLILCLAATEIYIRKKSKN
tara:strand:+ start:238 stop:1044 length:807 start_codon:yes stop_codon:yes gene_type:complete